MLIPAKDECYTNIKVILSYLNEFDAYSTSGMTSTTKVGQHASMSSIQYSAHIDQTHTNTRTHHALHFVSTGAHIFLGPVILMLVLVEYTLCLDQLYSHIVIQSVYTSILSLLVHTLCLAQL